MTKAIAIGIFGLALVSNRATAQTVVERALAQELELDRPAGRLYVIMKNVLPNVRQAPTFFPLGKPREPHE